MEFVEGNISVKAVLQANRRKVKKVLVDVNKQDKDTRYILHRVKERNIELVETSREEIDALAQGSTHGGLVAYCDTRAYQTLDDVEDTSFLALIEGVEDPFNFGYILRTLYAFGCTGVIVPARNWSTATTTVTKASAGASEYIPIIVAEDMEQMLQDLQARGITLIGANRKDAVSIHDYTFPTSLCIAIGGEMRGLSKLVERACEENVYIPYNQEFRNALTASSSVSVFAYEIAKQLQQS